MLAKSPFQLRSLLCIHVCQGLLCWKRQEKLWPEFSLGNCQDGRTARGQQQKKFFRRKNLSKTTRSLRGPGRRNICFENIAKNKSWLNKGALWNSLQNGEEQQAFVMTAEASEAKQRKACQPFWRTVNFDALFQIKANFSFTSQNNNKLGDNIKKKSNGILY